AAPWPWTCPIRRKYALSCSSATSWWIGGPRPACACRRTSTTRKKRLTPPLPRWKKSWRACRRLWRADFFQEVERRPDSGLPARGSRSKTKPRQTHQLVGWISREDTAQEFLRCAKSYLTARLSG